MILYFGCDPGWSGAIAAVDERGAHQGGIQGYANEWELIEKWRAWNPSQNLGAPVLLERVWADPKWGASAGALLQAYGAARCLFAYERFKVVEQVPVTWQKALGIVPERTKGSSLSGDATLVEAYRKAAPRGSRGAESLAARMKGTHGGGWTVERIQSALDETKNANARKRAKRAAMDDAKTAACRRLFPGLTVKHDGLRDALLLAEVCRMLHVGRAEPAVAGLSDDARA